MSNPNATEVKEGQTDQGYTDGGYNPLNPTNFKHYAGRKELLAMPMTRGQWCLYRGWQLPEGENPGDDGYMVKYLDGGAPNHPDHEYYISWSPKDVFERTYKPVSNDGTGDVSGPVIHTDHNGLEVMAVLGLEVNGEVHKTMPGHSYLVTGGNVAEQINFQAGPVPQNGVNGLTNEALLVILIHHTTTLDAMYPCDENKAAIEHMTQALSSLEERTKKRVARGVEGKQVV